MIVHCVNTKTTRTCETNHENLDTESVSTQCTHINYLKTPPVCNVFSSNCLMSVPAEWTSSIKKRGKKMKRACMHACAPLQFRDAAERGGRLLKMTALPTTPHLRTNLYSCTFAKHIIKHNRVFITDCQEIPAHLHSNLICHTESSCIQEIILHQAPTTTPTLSCTHTPRAHDF